MNNVIYNLTQLILGINKFRKDDLDIRHASINKRTSVGFEPGTTISNSLLTGPYLSLTTRKVSSLYVYTDIIHSQHVGDVKVPFLRIVGVDGQHGNSVTKTSERPQYLPVCRHTLDITEIDIEDDAGDSISFQHGKLVVKLHFRKQRSAYFS